LKKFYPQHEWDPLRFNKVPQRYWNEDTERQALEKFGRKLGVKELDDWYNMSAATVRTELSFIQKYGSLFNALKSLYPQHNWDPLRFSRVPQVHWNDEGTHRDALERLGKELGVKELDDWYHVSSRRVHQQLWFIQKYGSLFEALKHLYPQHNWDPLRFTRVPHRYWQRTSIVQHYHKLFLNWKKTYNVQNVSDWYELPPHLVVEFKRASMGIFRSQKKMLEEWFPEMVWQTHFTSQLQLQVLPTCCI
jgi:hypothetical protein